MLRPLEDDLKVRTLYGYGRDWPITYAELEPWLLLAEQETGVSGNDDNPYAAPGDNRPLLSAGGKLKGVSWPLGMHGLPGL